MFQRPFHIKTNTSMKGSAKRKLRTELEKKYPLLTPEQASLIIPVKDDFNVAKIQVHSGEVLTVYYTNGQPMLIGIDDNLFPSVYSQWLAPNMLPILYTHEFVWEKMLGGADLMLPGVMLPERGVFGLPKLTVGAPCAVAFEDNGAAIAIGIVLIDTPTIKSQGMIGKGVRIIHVYKDLLWGDGNKDKLPTCEPPVQGVTGSNEAEDATEAETSETDIPNISNLHLELSQCEGYTSPDDEPVTSTEANQSPQEEACQESVTEELDPDALLNICFLTALKSSVKDTMLPMLTSTFSAQHLLPSRPPGSTIEMKKTSFKKLSKFLEEMQRRGFIQIKQQSKGVEVIAGVNRVHPELREFVVPKYETNSDQDKEDDKPFAVQEVFKPTNALKPFFGDIPKHKYYMFSDIREVVNIYATANNLIDPRNKRVIQLDPHLTAVLLTKHEDLKEMPREDVVNRMVNKCQPYHRLSPVGQDPVIRKGSAPKIQVVCQQIMGRKVVTLVRGLSLFCVDVDGFARELQTMAAASSTVQPCSVGGQATGPEVLIQGHAVRHVESALQSKYAIPKKFLEITDKSGRAKSRK